MRLKLYGGFGEKGRTSIGLETATARLIIDAGINTSATRDGASAANYYPAITPADLAAADALVITHGHEDHLGGLGWCLAHGFRGRILMTPETRAEIGACLGDYAAPADRALALAAAVETFGPGDRLTIGDLSVATGRSGHVAGGVWCSVAAEGKRVLYCGDVVPDSTVFAYDPPPPADVVLFDASYGDDDVAPEARAAAVLGWAAAHPSCLLPTPLAGRSLELLALLDPPLALADGLRAALAAQIADAAWLWPGLQARLAERLAAARDWTARSGWPDGPLLTHDAMGLGGPAVEDLARAARDGHPVLLTGHVPLASPAYALRQAGKADWLRLPTHPTRSQNLGLLAACRPRLSLGHSCEPALLAGLASRIPTLDAGALTGQSLDI